jgi:hypothetical protein
MKEVHGNRHNNNPIPMDSDPYVLLMLSSYNIQAGRFRRLIGTMSPPDDTDKAEIYVEVRTMSDRMACCPGTFLVNSQSIIRSHGSKSRENEKWWKGLSDGVKKEM